MGSSLHEGPCLSPQNNTAPVKEDPKSDPALANYPYGYSTHLLLQPSNLNSGLGVEGGGPGKGVCCADLRPTTIPEGLLDTCSVKGRHVATSPICSETTAKTFRTILSCKHPSQIEKLGTRAGHQGPTVS